MKTSRIMKNLKWQISFLLIISFGCDGLWTEKEELCGNCIPEFRFELIGEHYNTQSAESYRIDTLDADGWAIRGDTADFLPGKISLLLKGDSTFRIEYNSPPDSVNKGNWTSLSEEKYESDFHLYAFGGDFRSEVFRQDEWYELKYFTGRKGAVRISRLEGVPGYVALNLLEIDPFRSGKIWLNDSEYPVNNCCYLGFSFGFQPTPYYGQCDWYTCDSRNNIQEW